MKPVKAVYTIPHLKLSFIVVCPHGDTNSTLSSNRKTREYFERILLWKHRKSPIEDLQWRIKRVPESDFLKSIEQCKSISLEYTSPVSRTPLSMELLAMNLGKGVDSDPTYFTPKLLDSVEIEDIIEVFI